MTWSCHRCFAWKTPEVLVDEYMYDLPWFSQAGLRPIQLYKIVASRVAKCCIFVTFAFGAGCMLRLLPVSRIFTSACQASVLHQHSLIPGNSPKAAFVPCRKIPSMACPGNSFRRFHPCHAALPEDEVWREDRSESKRCAVWNRLQSWREPRE